MPKVSAEHKEARRRQILDAATTCFAQYGVRETTIARICKEAGLSAGAVYRYFPGKKEILEAVYAESLKNNRSYGDQVQVSDDPVATLRGLVAGMVHMVAVPELKREHHLALRVHAEALADPDLAETYVQLQRAVVEQMTPLIQDIQRRGLLAPGVDAEYFLWVIISAYQGLRVQYTLDPSLDLERFGATLQQLVDGLLRPTP